VTWRGTSGRSARTSPMQIGDSGMGNATIGKQTASICGLTRALDALMSVEEDNMARRIVRVTIVTQIQKRACTP
jgi:hypothetical protein